MSDEKPKLKQVVYPTDLLEWAEAEGIKHYGVTNFSELARLALSQLRLRAQGRVEAPAAG